LIVALIALICCMPAQAQWQAFSVYQGSTCTGTPVLLNGTFLGSSTCTSSVCNCANSFCQQTTCQSTQPSSSSFAASVTQYTNSTNCATSTIASFAAYNINQCINYATGTSSVMTTCTAGAVSVNTYTQLNCLGAALVSSSTNTICVNVNGNNASIFATCPSALPTNPPSVSYEADTYRYGSCSSLITNYIVTSNPNCVSANCTCNSNYCVTKNCYAASPPTISLKGIRVTTYNTNDTNCTSSLNTQYFLTGQCVNVQSGNSFRFACALKTASALAYASTGCHGIPTPAAYPPNTCVFDPLTNLNIIVNCNSSSVLLPLLSLLALLAVLFGF